MEHNWVKIQRDNEFTNEWICENCKMISFTFGLSGKKGFYRANYINFETNFEMISCEDFIIKSIIE